MKRKELIALPPLGITEEIRELARKDNGKRSGTNERYIRYNHHTYMRSAVINGILKVEAYKRKSIRQGNEEPEYIIFLSKEENEYTTYLVSEKKWSSSKAGNLKYSDYAYTETYSDYCWISEDDQEMISRYLKSEYKDPYKAIDKWQTAVMHGKEINEIDKAMDQITETPADFREWAEEEVFWEKEYLFYDGANEKAYCTACKKTLKIKMRSKHNEYVTCPACGRIVMAKSWKKQRVIRNDRRAALIQKVLDGYAVRYFGCTKIYELENRWEGRISLHEFGRLLKNKRMQDIKEYEYGNFKQTGDFRWCRAKYIYGQKAVVYRKNLDEVFQGGGLQNLPYGYLFEKVKGQAVNINKLFNPDKTLEYMIKSGLTRLSLECMGQEYPIRKKKGTAQEVLGIDGNRLSRLKQMNGGRRILNWLRYEQKTGVKIRQDVMARLDWKKINVTDIEKIMEFGITPERALNYIEKQNGGTAAVLTEWKDYLNMAERERLNMADDIVRFPRELKRRHNELVELKNQKKDRERLKKYRKKDQKIAKRLQEAARYYWQDEEYMIVPAAKCEELIKEGRALHHCVGASTNYMDKMADGISWILFLRKKKAPDIPFYTIEIEMKTDRILQWYSEYNRKPEKDKIQKVLNKFQRNLKRQNRIQLQVAANA